MLPKHGMIYVEDMKKATLAEFDKVEADWRETAERQYECLADYERVPTPEETEAVDDCDPVYEMVADPTAVSFVGSGSSIPVRQFSTSPLVIMKPFKSSSIVVVTNETLRSTTPNIETSVRQKLSDDLNLGTDTLMLDANAASATRPAGLRNGIAALNASVAASPLEAMMADAAAVTGAVASVARNGVIALCASPKQANALRLWSRPNFPYEILSTSGLADKTLLAIATNCLITAAGVPSFSVVDQAVVHFDDTDPADITTASVQATIKSLFQSDETGLRVVADVSWALRSSSGVAWIENTNW